MPKKQRSEAAAALPSTLERSPKKAAATYTKVLASAENEYAGDEARAHRAAWSAVKHGFEKVGDHWETKSEPGPSDSRSIQPHDAKLAGAGETFGGVDVLHHTKAELQARAKDLGIEFTSRLTKDDLARKIAAKQLRS